jgi:hypothetical protein
MSKCPEGIRWFEKRSNTPASALQESLSEADGKAGSANRCFSARRSKTDT